MKTAESIQWRRSAIWLLRSAFFALGALIIVASLAIAHFRLAGPGAIYPSIVRMGLILGIPLLILGLLAGAAARHESVRVLLVIALAGAVAIIGGFALIGLGGGDMSLLGRIGHIAALIGMPGLLLTFLVTVPIAIIADAFDRRDQHRRGGPPARTSAP